MIEIDHAFGSVVVDERLTTTLVDVDPVHGSVLSLMARKRGANDEYTLGTAQVH